MRRQPETIEQLARRYGPGGVGNRIGIVSDHISWAERLGGRLVKGSLTDYIVEPDGTAWPVVCGDIVEIWTEDGPTDGRCGALASHDGACPSHAAERDAWLALTEQEKAFIERQEEAWR